MTQKKRRRGEASGSVPQRGTRWGRGRRRPYVGPEPPPSWEGAGTRTASRMGGAAPPLSSRRGRASPCAEAHARPPAMGRPAAGGGRPPAMGRPPFADWWQSETGICSLRCGGGLSVCAGSAPLKQEAEGHAVSFIPRRDVYKTRKRRGRSKLATTQPTKRKMFVVLTKLFM